MEKIKWEDLTESERAFAVRIQHNKEAVKKLKDDLRSQHSGCFSGDWVFEEFGITFEEMKMWSKGFVYAVQEEGLKISMTDAEGRNFFSNFVNNKNNGEGDFLRLTFELFSHLIQSRKTFELMKKEIDNNSSVEKIIGHFSPELFMFLLEQMIEGVALLEILAEHPDYGTDPSKKELLRELINQKTKK
ncbi:hypothetical protein LD119_00697 [Mesoplasma sp. JKS002660]|nr:hypothetical protein [Mesoplasma sp. JKS002660]